MQNTMNEDVIEIDLQEVLMLLLSKIWLIGICGLVGAAAAFCISFFLITPQYESATSVYILNKNESNTLTYSDMQLGTQLTEDYAQLITSRRVLEDVMTTCGLTDTYDELAGRVEVETISDTRLIKITVTDPEPAVAQQIANEIREVAAERIVEVMDIQAVNMVDEANLPDEPASPSVPMWTVVGLAVGMLLVILGLVIRFLLDDSIKTTDDVEKYLDLSTLAMIPLMETPETARKGKRKTWKHLPVPQAVEDLDSADEDEEPEEKKEEGTKNAKH